MDTVTQVQSSTAAELDALPPPVLDQALNGKLEDRTGHLMAIYVGTSGWSYDHWQGILYPHDVPSRDRLGYYLQRFNTVELNSSFYRWSADTTFASWRRRLPAGFLMTVKAPRGLTHGKRLYAPEAWLQRIAHGVQRLGDKLGVLLVQLAPGFECDLARLRYFLEHKPPGLRMALEFRHPSWHCEVVFDLLQAHQVAYCVMSGAGLPCVLRVTASYVYVRLHGPDQYHLYGGSYADNDLRWWADRIQEWAGGGQDVFAYFNNDGHGHAVRNAETLRWMLGC